MIARCPRHQEEVYEGANAYGYCCANAKQHDGNEKSTQSREFLSSFSTGIRNIDGKTLRKIELIIFIEKIRRKLKKEEKELMDFSLIINPPANTISKVSFKTDTLYIKCRRKKVTENDKKEK